MTINLAIAGATGWTGSAIADGALAAPDITLASAIARSSAGQDLGTTLGREPLGVRVHGNVTDALDGVDVLVEFTSHAHAKEIALAAIEHGVAVVIGSSRLVVRSAACAFTARQAPHPPSARHPPGGAGAAGFALIPSGRVSAG